MKYVIRRITEDDFGCEERAEDEPVRILLLLEGEDGREKWLRVPDEEKYQVGVELVLPDE